MPRTYAGDIPVSIARRSYVSHLHGYSLETIAAVHQAGPPANLIRAWALAGIGPVIRVDRVEPWLVHLARDLARMCVNAENVRCEACDAPQVLTVNGGVPWVHLHHPDYRRPVDVIPLCQPCHRRVHQGTLPEPRTGRVYPPFTANMLDTATYRRRGVRSPGGGWMVAPQRAHPKPAPKPVLTVGDDGGAIQPTVYRKPPERDLGFVPCLDLGDEPWTRLAQGDAFPAATHQEA